MPRLRRRHCVNRERCGNHTLSPDWPKHWHPDVDSGRWTWSKRADLRAGGNWRCKDCCRLYERENAHKRDPAKVRASVKRHYDKHREAVNARRRQRKRERRLNEPGFVELERAKARAYYRANKAACDARQARYDARNPEATKERKRAAALRCYHKKRLWSLLFEND